MLTAAEVEAYARDGALVLPGFLSPGTCAGLIARAEQLAAAKAGEGPRSVFTTTEQARRSDDWFLGSGDQVRCFFEEEAFTAEGELRSSPRRCRSTRSATRMHDLDPVFEALRTTRAWPSVAARPRACATRSRSGRACTSSSSRASAARWAGTRTRRFLYTDPMTVTGFWFALEDATLDNGCLWVAPGGHRGPLRGGSVARRRGRQRVRGPRLHAPAGPRGAAPLAGRRRHAGAAARPAAALRAGPTARRAGAWPTRCTASSAAADYPGVQLVAAWAGHAAAPARRTGPPRWRAMQRWCSVAAMLPARHTVALVLSLCAPLACGGQPEANKAPPVVRGEGRRRPSRRPRRIRWPSSRGRCRSGCRRRRCRRTTR